MKTISNIVDDCLETAFSEFTGEISPAMVDCSNGYDSEWEREFQWTLEKHLPPGFILRNQISLCNRYRADFGFIEESTGKTWIVEFDGKSFHDEWNDKRRDLHIFKEHPEVMAIVRVDASTGINYPHETTAILCRLIPKCFAVSDRIKGKEWVNRGDCYTLDVFSETENLEDWIDYHGNLLEGAPISTLSVSIRKQHPPEQIAEVFGK